MDATRVVLESDLVEIAAGGLEWGALEGATMLLTGATGLVGAYLVEGLAARSRLYGTRPMRFVLLARDPGRAAARFAHLARGQVRVVEHRLDRPLELEGEAEFIIHAGAPATPTAFVEDPVGSYVPNVLGTHHLLEWAASHGVRRFCFVSSGSVQGALGAGSGSVNEHDFGPLDPLDPYAAYAESKRMGEAAVAAWARGRGLGASVARLGHTYGPGLSRSDTRSFAEFVFAAVDGRDIVLHSSGATKRPFCYLTDAVTGLLTVLLEGAPAEAYFVVNAGAVLSIRQLAELVVGLRPDAGIAVRYDGEARSGAHPAAPDDIAIPDVSRLEALGWSARIPPLEGFGRTVAAHLVAAGAASTGPVSGR